MAGKKPTLPRLHIRNQLHHFDINFVKKMSPYFGLLEKYFRYQAFGLERVPKKGPGMIVMNHGVIPFHGFLLAKKIFDRYGFMPRSLGAGFLFDIPGVREFFLKGGAVNANPKNALILLNEKNLIALAPGGIYEALVAHPGMKRIPWERRFGFVEIACRKNAPIIPTYCHGINEAYWNSKFLLKLRIKLLEKIRFSLPLVFGIGLLPLPVKLTHYVGRTIPTGPRKGEDIVRRCRRIHNEVIDEMEQLRDQPDEA